MQENLILAKLKKARNDAGLSGDEVAKKIGKSDNSFISRLENGKIKLTIDIINKLCKLYKLNPMQLFSQPDNSVVQTSKRKSFLDTLEYRTNSGEISESTKNKVKTILPTLRKIGKVMQHLGDLPMMASDFFPRAELLNPSSLQNAKKLGRSVAFELRKYLNLGNDPIADIQNLVWHELKIPICSLDLGDKCWGIYSQDSFGNPLIIYSDSHETKQRNVFTIAHELGHHFFSPEELFIDINNSSTDLKIKEVLADAFAQELLVPTESLNQYMKEEGLCLIEIEKKHIIQLCQYFKVSYLMMLIVLRSHEMITQKEFDELKNYNLSNLKSLGYSPEKYMAEVVNLDKMLESLVAKGLRKERISLLFASEMLDKTEQEVKAFF